MFVFICHVRLVPCHVMLMPCGVDDVACDVGAMPCDVGCWCGLVCGWMSAGQMACHSPKSPFAFKTIIGNKLIMISCCDLVTLDLTFALQILAEQNKLMNLILNLSLDLMTMTCDCVML